MAEEKRPASAIYAGLDDTLKTPAPDRAGGENGSVPSDGGMAAHADAAAPSAASGDEAAAPAVASGASAAPSAKASGSKAGAKAVIAIIAIVSVAIIAVSAFALAGGFAPKEAASTAAQVSAASESEEGSEDAAEEGAVQDDASASDDAAVGDAASESSASAGSSDASASATVPESSSSGSAASTPAPSEPIRQEPSVPATITVAVSVDSSAVGSPVSLVTNVTLNQGKTVYDALVATGLSVNAHSSQFGMYVAGIGGLAEKEHGATSGWTYYHNGVFVNNAASGTVLSDGDAISWVYVTG